MLIPSSFLNGTRPGHTGATWQALTPPGAYTGWKAVVFGKGLFVAVRDTSTGTIGTPAIYSSPDGVTWTLRYALTVAGSANIERVVFDNNMFMACDYDRGRIFRSYDGISWAETNPVDATAIGNDLSWVAWAGDRWLTGWGNWAYKSFNDGVSWTREHNYNGGTNLGIYNAAYLNGNFVAMSSSSSANKISSNNNFATASTGVSFGANNDVAVGNGMIICTLSTTYRVSTDAFNFTGSLPYPAGLGSFTKLSFIKGKFTAVSTTSVITSPDGSTWTTVSTGASRTTAKGVAYGNGRYVIHTFDTFYVSLS